MILIQMWLLYPSSELIVRIKVAVFSSKSVVSYKKVMFFSSSYVLHTSSYAGQRCLSHIGGTTKYLSYCHRHTPSSKLPGHVHGITSGTSGCHRVSLCVENKEKVDKKNDNVYF